MRKLLTIAILLLPVLVCSQKKASVDTLRVNEYLVILDASGDTLAEFSENKVRIFYLQTELQFDAIAWLPDGTNPARRDTLLNREEIYLFDDVTEEDLFIKFHLPPTFIGFDSLVIWQSTITTNGDSVSWEVSTAVNGRGEATEQAFTASIRDTTEFNPALQQEFEISTFTNLGVTIEADDWMWLRLRRKNGISDNYPDDVRFHGTTFYYH